MSDFAIRVEDLSKKYIINHKSQQKNDTFRDMLSFKAKCMARRLRHPFGGFNQEDPSQEEFWALKDINFEIKQGDRVGIIGRNGAGKSTLLKILSRITEPTTGKISINGRVASLLEVGTGFHPELTGRENIFLNGAIMGMSKWEIKAKFDEIVAFAEVEKFLDTPVKRYSSGMYVRLAFAVAAHLEPEILIVDEVLAVGDAVFQKKCLEKMKIVADQGKAVLFVSHNLESIKELCTTGILLTNGGIQATGGVRSVISKYLDNNTDKTMTSSIDIKDSHRKVTVHKEVEFLNVKFLSNYPNNLLKQHDNLTLEILFKGNVAVELFGISGGIINDEDKQVASFFSKNAYFIKVNETQKMRLTLESCSLAPGIYSINLAFGKVGSSAYAYDCVYGILQFEVDNNAFQWKNSYGYLNLSNNIKINIQ